MKTLNEVRKAFEYCLTPERGCQRCPGYVDRTKPCYIWGEALFYLNKYATSLHNEPLTWSELQELENKPVWLDTYDKTGWAIYGGTAIKNETVCAEFVFGRSKYTYCLKADINKSWTVFWSEPHD